MIMFAVVMVVILGLAYVWVTRGFLSSLLHMICVVLAGAVAFGVWETSAYFILGKTSNAALTGAAWAIALIVPFAVVTVLLRLAADAVVRNNAQAPGPIDYVGAGVCGLITGTITAGILVIGIGTTRVGSDFLGYQPLNYQSGSLARTGGLLLPVDRMVGAFYGHTSEAAFSTGEPLARYYPDPSHMGASLRMTDGEGKARNTAKPGDYSIAGSYIIGAGAGLPGNDLLKDQWNPATHNATNLKGDAYSGPQKLLGVWIDPKASMKERGGDIIFGEGQVFLVAERRDTAGTVLERIIRHPVAIVSPAEPASEGKYGRWRYDAKVFVALPGAAVSPMAFEFITPPDATPVAIFVKGVRENLDTLQPREFATTSARDTAIAGGSILPKGISSTPLDASQAQALGNGRGQTDRNDLRDDGIIVGSTFPLRMAIQKGTHGGLILDEDNNVIGGENKFSKEQMVIRGMSKELRVNQFGLRKGTVMVQIEVSQTKPGSLLGGAMAAAENVLPPVVVDERGTQYQAIGWVYRDRDLGYFRYTPDQPIRGLSELQDKGVSISRSRPDQELVLLFEVTENVNLTSFGMGGKEILSFTPPLEVGRARSR